MHLNKKTTSFPDIDIDFSDEFIAPVGAKVYSSINEVWEDLEKGVEIYWASLRYKLYISDADCEYQLKHFTCKNGKVLSARDIDTYWGGLLAEQEVSKIFSFGVKNIKNETNNCHHLNKQINHAGGIKFWQCAVCKKDLGNV